MRGLEKVRAEFSLTALAYNLRRVLNIVGFAELMAAHCAALKAHLCGFLAGPIGTLGGGEGFFGKRAVRVTGAARRAADSRIRQHHCAAVFSHGLHDVDPIGRNRGKRAQQDQ